MKLASSYGRCIACIMLAAIVLSAAFQPGWMRQAVKPGALEAGVVEICTGTGMKWIDLATGEVRDAPADSMPGTSLDHCPCCTTQAAWMPASAQMPSLLQIQVANALPFLYWHAPRPLFAWTHASPRAPPARA